MSPIVPSITGIFEQLDGQRPGPTLYDLIMGTRFVRKPRERSLSRSGGFTRLCYESNCGKFRYTTEIVPDRWSTWSETLTMTVGEPVLYDSQFTSSRVAESIFHFKVAGMGRIRMSLDLRQGKYLEPLVPEFSLKRSREHEWNHCWTRENPKTFFDRRDYDEIWKALMLLAVSIDRTDPDLKMKNRWWSRQTVSTTLFRRHLQNGDGKPYTP